jgi:hypothetical protein
MDREIFYDYAKKCSCHIATSGSSVFEAKRTDYKARKESNNVASLTDRSEKCENLIALLISAKQHKRNMVKHFDAKASKTCSLDLVDLLRQNCEHLVRVLRFKLAAKR